MLCWVTGTFVPENFRSRERKFHRCNFRSLELSYSTSKLAWNFRSLTLIIRLILYTIFDAFFNYSYAVGVDGTIVVCLSPVCLSVMDVLRISVGS